MTSEALFVPLSLGVVLGEYGYASVAGTADFISTVVILVLAVIGVSRGALRGWRTGVWLGHCCFLIVTLPTRATRAFARRSTPIS